MLWGLGLGCAHGHPPASQWPQDTPYEEGTKGMQLFWGAHPPPPPSRQFFPAPTQMSPNSQRDVVSMMRYDTLWTPPLSTHTHTHTHTHTC